MILTISRAIRDLGGIKASSSPRSTQIISTRTLYSIGLQVTLIPSKPTLTSSTVAMDADQFKILRENVVQTLQSWTSEKENLVLSTIANALKDMATHIDRFQLLTNDDTGPCFPHRCRILKRVMAELSKTITHGQTVDSETVDTLQMLALQVGRLTLTGYSQEDTFAAEMARLCEGEGEKWENRSREDRRRLRAQYSLWIRIHFKLTGCGCLQCVDAYVPIQPPSA
ncbi:uncharacterized protein N7459_004002 [Penicillium hispanicum]|uniref:uncharacterized protein n=1 Tax=Penicillium hispanicum TaxID=1080232 RepID=UPI002541D7BF|nr:uncharacterized protein N7459_004002 [Penicillium hispanicum]KAJ5584202.1 hypothetical protein N7459_004002 [Penicillium hispanicum]